MTTTKTTCAGASPDDFGVISQSDRWHLQQLVTTKAQLLSKEIGFDWVGSPLAPSTYQQLRGAYQHSVSTGYPLPVSNLFCERTIYLNPSDNVAFRFWHDASHVRLGLSFQLEDELELANWHLAEVKAAGYDEDTSVYRLLQHDLLGQVFLQGVIGRFPFDQEAFVATCMIQGLTVGLLSEIRRLEPLASVNTSLAAASSTSGGA